MWEQWKDFRLDEAPPMFAGAKKSALKDIASLEKNMKMMIHWKNGDIIQNLQLRMVALNVKVIIIVLKLICCIK